MWHSVAVTGHIIYQKRFELWMSVIGCIEVRQMGRHTASESTNIRAPGSVFPRCSYVHFTPYMASLVKTPAANYVRKLQPSKSNTRHKLIEWRCAKCGRTDGQQVKATRRLNRTFLQVGRKKSSIRLPKKYVPTLSSLYMRVLLFFFRVNLQLDF